MSRLPLLKDNRGAISLLLSQIGLLLATGVLIGAIASLTFYNDWQKEAEAKNIASHFATAVESMDLKEFPGQTTYLFPQKNYRYEVLISTDYITIVREDGTTTDKIIGRKTLLIKPYVRPIERNWRWNNSEELHNFLKDIHLNDVSGHSGYADDPFPIDQKNEITTYLKDELSDTATKLANEPLHLENEDEPVFIEKTFIYFEKDGNLERYGIVIIHQKGG
ncbi:MAG: hypothetical protein U9O96_02795 [Candidatus Thermoplasmatota archaeon]|nr:hypothetical protein [Candidatus Thermoplasmatota archaeon]